MSPIKKYKIQGSSTKIICEIKNMICETDICRQTNTASNIGYACRTFCPLVRKKWDMPPHSFPYWAFFVVVSVSVTVDCVDDEDVAGIDAEAEVSVVVTGAESSSISFS